MASGGASEAGVAAGVDASRRVFAYLECEAGVATAAGDLFEAGETVLRVTGPARDVPRGERVAVNVAGHASGIATETRRAVNALATDHPEVLAEASGGIDHADVADYAATGVDVISMGHLTHSAPALDFSFRTGEGRQAKSS